MKLTKRQLRAIILEELTKSSLLFEEEDESGLFDSGESDENKEGSDEEAAGDEEADDASDKGDEDTGEKEGEEGEEEEEGGEEDKDKDTSEDEEDEEDEEDTAGPVGDEVDVALKDVMADFEKRALDAAAAKSKLKPVGVKSQKEGRLSLTRLLFEVDDDDDIKIDVGTFAADIARLITNYDTLIDMEGVIYSKAMDFIEKKYGKDYADQLRDTLAREHNIEIDVEQDPEAAEKPIFAVGATGGGGAA